MSGVREVIADDSAALEGEDNPTVAFVGRVLAAFVTLIALAAFVLAMIGLAYSSKHELPLRPQPTPAGHGNAVVEGPPGAPD